MELHELPCDYHFHVECVDKSNVGPPEEIGHESTDRLEEIFTFDVLLWKHLSTKIKQLQLSLLGYEVWAKL
jgi:hypothetical protein